MSTSQAEASARYDFEDAIDQELLDLPAPPRRERSATVGLLALTAVASLAMVAALRQDARYAFAGIQPTDLGDLGATSDDGFMDGAFVRGHAMVGAAHAIKFERPLVSDSFRLMPVAGHPSVWVEVRVPAGAESVRYVPPNEFTGHLVRFASAGPRHRGLASAIHDATGQKVPTSSWLLVAGETPTGSRWALVLVAMFLGFAVWNLGIAAKLMRKVR